MGFLFSVVKTELTKINEWFVAKRNFRQMSKKLSTLFYQKPSNKDNILFRLPNSTINNHKIKGEEIKKDFGVLLKENLLWKNHFKYIESKFQKQPPEVFCKKRCS